MFLVVYVQMYSGYKKLVSLERLGKEIFGWMRIGLRKMFFFMVFILYFLNFVLGELLFIKN